MVAEASGRQELGARISSKSWCMKGGVRATWAGLTAEAEVGASRRLLRKNDMALKFRYKTKDEIPAELVSLYAEREGGWQLDCDGVADQAKLDEFRNNNTALLRQVEELKRRFERSESEQVRAIAAERDGLMARLAGIEIDQAVVRAAGQRGLRGSAGPDIAARARGTFRLVNGVPQAFEVDGTTVRCGRDGVTPLSVEEWVDAQVSEAPHLFESNAGSGAAGNGSGGVVGVKNPFRKGADWNVTEQMRLLKSDPQLAARLKAAA